MSTFHDYRWHGSPDAMTAALPVLAGTDMIGPREVDGVVYIAVRASAPVEMPAGLAVTGPEMSIALLGVWASDEPE